MSPRLDKLGQGATFGLCMVVCHVFSEYPSFSEQQNIKNWKCDMTSEIAFLLRRGWINLWKSKVLWGFVFLFLIPPLIRPVTPVPQYNVSSLSISFMVLDLVCFFFAYVGAAGVFFVAYSVAIGKSVDFITAFRVSIKLFWRFVGIMLLLTLVIFVLVVFPCVLAFFVFYKGPVQMEDAYRNFILLFMVLSVFQAIWCFPITECIANNSKVIKSLKSAWKVFMHNFVRLAVIGFVLAAVSHLISVLIGVAVMFAQYGFYPAVLNEFDFIIPHMFVAGNGFYKLLSAVVSSGWQAYAVSVFTLAYLRDSAYEMNVDSAIK